MWPAVAQSTPIGHNLHTTSPEPSWLRYPASQRHSSRRLALACAVLEDAGHDWHVTLSSAPCSSLYVE